MKRQILLVDDSELEALAVKSTLEKTNYTVTVVESGLEALKLIETSDTDFEIIIIDWFMPGMDGIQLCINIRQMQLRINPFIIILTGNQWDGAELTALSCGADDFIEKPFDADKVRARLLLAERIIGYQHQLLELSKTAESR